jgi:hypothetical protein
MRSTPPEILEHIAGFCAQDKHTLCQLSLVSTSCLALARRQLFAEITLKPPSPTIFQFPFERLFIDSPCSGFLALINDAERRGSQLGTVAPFVRHLRLHEGSGMSSWLVTDPSLPPLLQALPNLLSFRLSRVGVTPISWIGIPFACRNAIGKFVLSQSTLIEVTLSGLAFQSLQQLNTLLASCRALRTLEVDHVGVQEGELEAETGASVEKVALDTLTLGPFTSILFMRSLLQPSCPMRLDVVRKLGLSMSDNFSELTRILDASISLETLELVVTNRCKRFLNLQIIHADYSQWMYKSTGRYPPLNNSTYQSCRPCVIFESHSIRFREWMSSCSGSLPCYELALTDIPRQVQT